MKANMMKTLTLFFLTLAVLIHLKGHNRKAAPAVEAALIEYSMEYLTDKADSLEWEIDHTTDPEYLTALLAEYGRIIRLKRELSAEAIKNAYP